MRPWQWIGNRQWPRPPTVQALQTRRQPPARPVPKEALSGFNLGLNQEKQAVVAGRRRCLVSEAGLPGQPQWLEQVHGTRVVEASLAAPATGQQADAIIVREAGCVCAILTADCLPVLLARMDGKGVAAVHAGWRGLAAGVVERASLALGGAQSAWLGPCIGASAYEVDAQVREAFIAQHPASSDCFRAARAGHWWADLAGLARQRLDALGVDTFGSPPCTYTSAATLYSHRRDPASGRQASLIWLQGI